MKYKLVQKGKPGDSSAPKKWYANPVKSGVVNQKSLSKEIAGRSSLTSGDVSNVMQNLMELLPTKLMEGNSVQLGDFGTFRISFSSEGVENEKSFTVDKIKGLKIIFTPSTDFKKELSVMKFEQEK
ncbi:HU family DNA-binding protein [Ornithobacterium rhinotracheale]|uniref:Viral histone-like protein n=1 Tax=Ornithobacterium rhinotracheale TaxID=28251 RepID=A0A410JT18_ORNRH|nr:HU family DNA-binding protein [Ornithobacterium rhinotracheale]QAR31357.1 DNA-binding protein [Ornithobacterium rhinotracheale]